jgi:hypothetical protein
VGQVHRQGVFKGIQGVHADGSQMVIISAFLRRLVQGSIPCFATQKAAKESFSYQFGCVQR